MDVCCLVSLIEVNERLECIPRIRQVCLVCILAFKDNEFQSDQFFFFNLACDCCGSSEAAEHFRINYPAVDSYQHTLSFQSEFVSALGN